MVSGGCRVGVGRVEAPTFQTNLAVIESCLAGETGEHYQASSK